MADENMQPPQPSEPSEPSQPSRLPKPDWRTGVRSVRQSLRGAWQTVRGDGESPLADVCVALGNIDPRAVIWGLIALALLGYLASGLYVVAPGEAAVVRRFGAVVEPRVDPGLHYRLPWPVDRVDIVHVSQVRREIVGVTAPEEDHEHPEPPSRLQGLSGDTNVIDIELIVQYQVRDPAAYVTNVQYAPYRLMRDVMRSAVTGLVTRQPVDNILTVDRQSLQNAIRDEAQAQLDAYDSGLSIVGINLQRAFPPEQVAQAFTDVNSAKEDRARAVNEALGYANSLIPQARGEANKALAEADAYRASTLAQAKGSAQAFDALRKEYETNAKIYGRDVTRYRLYLETLDKVLPNAQVYVMDTENGGAMTLRLYTNPQQVSEGTQQK